MVIYACRSGWNSNEINNVKSIYFVLSVALVHCNCRLQTTVLLRRITAEGVTIERRSCAYV